jgi:putative endonuclease
MLAGSFSDRYDCEKLVLYEVHEDIEAAIIREKRIKELNAPGRSG